jgi:hypothetical protein
MMRAITVGLILGLLIADPMAGSATEIPRPRPHDGYVAAIRGTCEELVIASRVVPICNDTLLNVDFANGRVAFAIAGQVGDAMVLSVLSGGASRQSDVRHYELTVDRMSTAATGKAWVSGVAPAEGTCTMRGDPLQEPARFECRLRSGGAETVVRFLSDPTATIETATLGTELDDLATLGPAELADGF